MNRVPPHSDWMLIAKMTVATVLAILLIRAVVSRIDGPAPPMHSEHTRWR